MFTELFHTTPIQNFLKIKIDGKILSREKSGEETQSNILPSNTKLVYFSCSEIHNLEYIEKGNILEADKRNSFGEEGIEHHLIQIKLLLKYDDLVKHKLILRYDEDSFLQPLLNNMKIDVDSYDINTFKQHKNDKEKLIKNILDFFPYKQFSLNSREYNENINFLIFSENPDFCSLLNTYYNIQPPLTCALENEVNIIDLKREGINILYRNILIKSMIIAENLNSHDNGEKEIFKIINIDKWQNF